MRHPYLNQVWFVRSWCIFSNDCNTSGWMVKSGSHFCSPAAVTTQKWSWSAIRFIRALLYILERSRSKNILDIEITQQISYMILFLLTSRVGISPLTLSTSLYYYRGNKRWWNGDAQFVPRLMIEWFKRVSRVCDNIIGVYIIYTPVTCNVWIPLL